MGHPHVLPRLGEGGRSPYPDSAGDLAVIRSDPADPHGDALLQPSSTAQLDQTAYRCVRFYGGTLEATLREAAEYLALLTRRLGKPPHVIGLHEEHSWDEPDPANAWQLSLIFSDVRSYPTD